MVKASQITVALMALAVFASCIKEMRETTLEIIPAGDKVYTSFLAGGEEQSKVVLSFADDRNVKWLDTDEVAVFDGVGKNSFTVKQGTNTGSSAVFEGNVDANATTLYAVYPASAAQALDDSSLSVTVPAAQVIGTGECADPAALVAVASAAKGSAMAFKQVCGLLKLSLSSNNTSKIIITGEALSGTAKVAADGTLDSVTEPAGTITLTHAEGVFPSGTYYVAVLPGTTAAGKFSVSVSSGLKAGVKKASSSVSFSRRKCLDAGSLDGLPMYTVISTKAELFEWNATRVVDDESDPDNVLLISDIDMGNETWTPKDFKGVFEGQGHRLYNLNVLSQSNACLFNDVTGTVKNLTVGSADGANYDGVSRLVQDNPGDTDENWKYAGLFASLNEGTVLENVVSFVPVTVAPASVSKTIVGGITGTVAGDAAIMNCSNRADITITNPSTNYIGGIVGLVDLTGGRFVIENCENHGDISRSVSSTAKVGDGNACIGGIAACLLAGNGKGSMVSACTNYGKVSTNTNAGNTAIRIAGIAAWVRSYTEVKDCGNNGDVEYRMGNAAVKGSTIHVGGIVGHLVCGSRISGCTNSGNIFSDRKQVNRAGGIAGTVNSSAVDTCTNTGNVEVNVPAGTAMALWQAAGGIAGFAEGATAGCVREIRDCVNRGEVSACINTVPQYEGRFGVGGIIGEPYSAFTIIGNSNYGPVSAENTNANTPWSFVGGVMGFDADALASVVSGNTNYGEITNASASAQYSAAGGLFGKVINAYGATGASFGSVNGPGAGAVAGVNGTDISAAVCDEVTVNSVNHAAAADKEVWACPQSSGTIYFAVLPHAENETGAMPQPLEAGNKVVAHRGGATESGYPDNSRAGLRYAMGLGCYASECDIYWTRDNKVIVAHANSTDYVNGMHPWEHDAEEIITAKLLSNGETIPTLEEYLDIVMESGSRTKLLLDIKMIDTPSVDYEHPAKAALRAIEIVKEKNAQNFVEFICTSYEGVMKKIAEPMKKAGLACGWMNGDISATSFKNKGYTDWANLCVRDKMSLGVNGSEDKGTGNRTIKEFKNAGLQLSVFHLDRSSGNSSAVYTDANVQLYLDEYDYLKCITTNYPAWLLQKTKNL